MPDSYWLVMLVLGGIQTEGLSNSKKPKKREIVGLGGGGDDMLKVGGEKMPDLKVSAAKNVNIPPKNISPRRKISL